MDDTRAIILADAVRAAIDFSKQAVKLRRLLIASTALNFVLAVLLIFK